MQMPLISVIMSVYNESINELEASISSILCQTYTNIEFIIVCDNPENEGIISYLKHINDKRVRIFYNKKNMGLVWSLNHALKYVNGEFVARMDADDICIVTRILDEYRFLTMNHCDIVGSYVELIDENDKTIKQVMRMPKTDKQIRFFMRFGSCICHPTWLVRKEVYQALSGYRNAPRCEDYDFIVRAIRKGFVVGNIDKVELKYRIRSSGISRTNAMEQYLVRDYLGKNYKKKSYPTQEDINKYLISDAFKKNCELMRDYVKRKQSLKSGDFIVKFSSMIHMMFNSIFWKDLLEKVSLFARER